MASSAAGVGGGGFIVPFLNSRGIDMKKSIGSSRILWRASWFIRHVEFYGEWMGQSFHARLFPRLCLFACRAWYYGYFIFHF